MNSLKRITKKVYQDINGKQLLFITIGFLLFTGFVLPFIASLTTSVIGVSESPDTNFTFHLSTLYEMLEAYGKKGRNFYILMRWTFDLIWPIVYTSFIVSLIAYFTKYNQKSYKFNHYLIPLIAMAFDYLENILATIIMAIYPVTSDILSYLLFTSSILKWGILILAFGFAVYVIIVYLYRKIKNV